MAQSTLHLSAGMLLGTLLAVPRVWRAWQAGKAVSPAIARWCLLSYGLGLYALLPSIIRRLAAAPGLADGPAWNLFLFYPLIQRLDLPSIALGELTTASLFALQYATILIAIHRTNERDH
ncbi:MAG TPA: hypothetical protein DCS43_01505 [Verrucomicrobia bacterium]|nr:hypothetical protein [Verrucomicrobiota bacterium]